MLRSLVVSRLTHDDRTGLSSVVDRSHAAARGTRGASHGTGAEGSIVQTVLSAVDTGALAATGRRLEEGGRKVPEKQNN